jgi:hypothetical protein
MTTPENIALRSARWSELLFAVIALGIAVVLTVFRPANGVVFQRVHWWAMTIAAFWLVVALRRPTRLTWIVTVVLSAYFLVSHVGLGLLFGPGISRLESRPSAFPVAMLSPVAVMMAILAQISVAIRCWSARALWTRRARANDAAPVARRGADGG